MAHLLSDENFPEEPNNCSIGYGIFCSISTGCIGTSANYFGLSATMHGGTWLAALQIATGCYGQSATGIGLESGATATDCCGYGAAGFSGGGGGGSMIDSSAIAILAEVSGVLSPDHPLDGETIITAGPTPLAITTGAAFGFTNGVFGFDVAAPSGANVVVQASTDLQSWIPLQINLLGSGPIYFSDARSTTNVQRFYRAKISP